MRLNRLIDRFQLGILVVVAASAPMTLAAEEFRVQPYLQNSSSDGVTIRWLSESAVAGTVEIDGRTYTSSPVRATALGYQNDEPQGNRYTDLPYIHSVRVDGLQTDTAYDYSVTSGANTLGGSFRTPIASAVTVGTYRRPGHSAVRVWRQRDRTRLGRQKNRVDPLVGRRVLGAPDWVTGPVRRDADGRYTQNLAIMQARAAEARADGRATLVDVVGDLVESGGEQRDWDEFWRHNAGSRGTFARDVPIVPALVITRTTVARSDAGWVHGRRGPGGRCEVPHVLRSARQRPVARRSGPRHVCRPHWPLPPHELRSRVADHHRLKQRRDR